jgi:hypothetical protein
VAILWKTVDRLGRPVVLTDEGWTHILSRHEDMVAYGRDVRLAVEFADEITIDARYQRRNVHYLRASGGRPPMRVVVNYQPEARSEWIGVVITAFRSERKKTGERHLWP